MKEKSSTGRHAAPSAAPDKEKQTGRLQPPVIEKTGRLRQTGRLQPPPVDNRSAQELQEELLNERHSKRRLRAVFGSLALVFVLLFIIAVALRGAAAERRFAEHMRIAREDIAAGDYENALGHLRQAATKEDSDEIRLMMVDCYESMGSYDKALELLRSMDLNDASLRARIDRLEEAREALRQADKIQIAGMELERTASSLIIRRTALSEEDLRLVSELYALSSLSLTEDELTDLSALSALGGLTMLDLSGNELRDLQPLASLTGLRTLYLDGNPIRDFTPLYGLQELRMLSIRNIEVSEEQLAELSAALPQCAIHSEAAVAEARELTLGGLTFSEDVTELDLSGRDLSDITALAACRELRTLDLSGNQLTELTALMDLPYLERLSFAGNRVADLRPLMAMRSLQFVDASDNAIASTAALSGLAELRELDLSGNELVDLSGLPSLASLEILSLENTHLRDEQLPALGDLSSLRELNLKENPDLTGEAVEELKRSLPECYFEHSRLVYTVELNGQRYRMDLTMLDLSGFGEPFDLSEIVRIPALEKLDLSGNKLESIYILKALEKLRELDLSDNEISDVTPLAYLTNLEKLDLSNNHINSVTALLNLTQLKELDVRGNDLTPEQIERLVNTLPDCEILHD